MLQRVSVFINIVFRELQSNLSSFVTHQTLTRILQLSIKDGIFFTSTDLWKKNTIFNGQLMNANKRLMCCETTVVGLKLSEDGVNKHR
jgi:hypothetical protein